VIPGGLWGHSAARILPDGYPQFFHCTEGFHLINADVRRAFCAEAQRHGAYLHPNYTMFLSCAHRETDIGRVLDAVDARFRHVAR
jgi:hypothetical protein